MPKIQKQLTPSAAAKKAAGIAAPTKKHAVMKAGEVEVSKNGELKRLGQIKRGATANPGGRGPGVKSVMTDAKIRYLSLEGQTPLEFLTAVYRDQLYDEYETETLDVKKGLARVFPKIDPITGDVIANKIDVRLEQRIAAATSAAPYVHRKKPIAIDGGEGKPVSFISAAQLATLSDEELDKLLSVLAKLNVGAEFEDGKREPYQVGDE